MSPNLRVTRVFLFCKDAAVCLGGGGVLRYISDGDVRSPFLGLKFAI